jgi:hypothetical protein
MIPETPPDDWVLLEAARLFGLPDEASDTLLHITYVNRAGFRALCDMIEQHEAFKQEVSDAMKKIVNDPNMQPHKQEPLYKFIISEPKPDPLVEVWHELFRDNYNWHEFIAALDARGFEIKEKKP